MSEKEYKIIEENKQYNVYARNIGEKDSTLAASFDTEKEALNFLYRYGSRIFEEENYSQQDLEKLRDSIEENYREFNIDKDVLRLYYDENDDLWELLFKEEELMVTENKEDAQRMLLMCQIIYSEALAEGLLIGSNHQELASQMLYAKSSKDSFS